MSKQEAKSEVADVKVMNAFNKDLNRYHEMMSEINVEGMKNYTTVRLYKYVDDMMAQVKMMDGNAVEILLFTKDGVVKRVKVR